MSGHADGNCLIQRRGFLCGSATAGATALGGLIPWHASRAAPTTAQSGGTLRFCRPDSPDTLDPQVSNSFSGYEYSQMIYDNLVWLDANDQAQPQLATSWTPENHGQEWLVTLRQGVRFHSGAELTSADVVASVERSLDRSRSGAGFGCAACQYRSTRKPTLLPAVDGKVPRRSWTRPFRTLRRFSD